MNAIKIPDFILFYFEVGSIIEYAICCSFYFNFVGLALSCLLGYDWKSNKTGKS